MITACQIDCISHYHYDRCYAGRRGLKSLLAKLIIGILGIRCLCVKCYCTKILSNEIAKVRLYRIGFKPNYWIWTIHGEETLQFDLDVDDNCMSSSSNGVDVGYDEHFMSFHEMMCDALMQHESFEVHKSHNKKNL